MADPKIDKDLLKSLQQARKKPRNFAIVAKGSTCLKLLVSKKPIKDGELLKAKKEYQGNVLIKGVVTGGDGLDLVFQVTEEPSLQPAKFKTFIKEYTGLPLKPRFAVVTAIQEVDEAEGEDTEAETEEALATPDPDSTSAPQPVRAPEEEPEESEAEAEEDAPPSPPPPNRDADKFASRLKALKPNLDKVLTAGLPVSSELKLRTGEVGALARNKEFGEAERLLDQVEQLIKQGLEELASKLRSQGDPGALFNARLKALLPAIKEAVSSGTDAGREIKVLASEAGSLAQQKDFAPANQRLDQIEGRLKGEISQTATPAPPETTDGGSGKFADLQKRLEPELLKAQKANPDKRTALGNLWNYAVGQAQAGHEDKAQKAFDALEKAIQDTLANAPKTDTERFGIREGLVAERRAEFEKYFAQRLAKAQAATEGQISSVEKAIAENVPDEEPADLAGSIQDALDDLYEQVSDALYEQVESEDAEAVLKAVEDWRSKVAGDALVQHLQEAHSQLGVAANVLDDFAELFDDVTGKVKELTAA